jgi:hypothetical protein
MQDSTYLDAIEVSEKSQQLNNLHDMIVRNNKTGFLFNPSTTLRSFRVFLKTWVPIAKVQIITPRSNVQQIRLSYFDEYNQTIKNVRLQDWQVNYISEYGQVNNTLDRLCPDFQYRGIQVDILQTNPADSAAHNATLKVFIRNCVGVGGQIRKFKLNRMRNKISLFV